MTFWTNQPILNIKYVFFTSALLLDTIFVKPIWNKNSNKYRQDLILKVLRGFFHILTSTMLSLRNIYRQFYIFSSFKYSPGLYIFQVEKYCPGLNSPFLCDFVFKLFIYRIKVMIIIIMIKIIIIIIIIKSGQTTESHVYPTCQYFCFK